MGALLEAGWLASRPDRSSLLTAVANRCSSSLENGYRAVCLLLTPRNCRGFREERRASNKSPPKGYSSQTMLLTKSEELSKRIRLRRPHRRVGRFRPARNRRAPHKLDDRRSGSARSSLASCVHSRYTSQKPREEQ